MKIFKKTLLFLVVAWCALLVAGCDIDGGTSNSRIDDYKCTVEQLDVVERELHICNKSSYQSGYCFAQAKKTHCEKIKVK